MDDTSYLADLLAWSLLQCKTAIVDNGDTLLSLFVAGLAGSAAHCLGMCGPFVFSQVAARLEKIPATQMSEFHRLRGAALIPYHLGRLSTYAVLGAVAAALSGAISLASGFGWLTPAMLTLGALFFIGYALKDFKIPFPLLNGGAAGQLLGSITGPLFSDPRGWRGYGLGLVLGFLPCGLLYGALAAAASTGNGFEGFFAMIAFAFGTMPALIVLGFLGHGMLSRMQAFTRVLAPLLLLANAGFLLYLAWKLI